MLSADRVILLFQIVSVLRDDLLAQHRFRAVLFYPGPRREDLLLMELFVLVHDVLYLHVVHLLNLRNNN